MTSKWKNRRHVSTLDPEVYEKDRAGFLRGLRTLHRAALEGHDTRKMYLIVENDRVVGVGGAGGDVNIGPEGKRRHPHLRPIL
jgi:hypothetical protein